MGTRKLHPDWPEWDDTKKSWDVQAPVGELLNGFEDYPSFRVASPGGGETPAFSMNDIAEVLSYHLSYGGTDWVPGEESTELNMVIVGRLNDGRFFSGALWNDYTGWGCQSGADFRVAGTIEDIHRYGLDASERVSLGLVAPE